jgi:hypothetical protein
MIEESNKIGLVFALMWRIILVHTNDSKVKFSGNPASLIICRTIEWMISWHLSMPTN